MQQELHCEKKRVNSFEGQLQRQQERSDRQQRQLEEVVPCPVFASQLLDRRHDDISTLMGISSAARLQRLCAFMTRADDECQGRRGRPLAPHLSAADVVVLTLIKLRLNLPHTVRYSSYSMQCRVAQFIASGSWCVIQHQHENIPSAFWRHGHEVVHQIGAERYIRDDNMLGIIDCLEQNVQIPHSLYSPRLLLQLQIKLYAQSTGASWHGPQTLLYLKILPRLAHIESHSFVLFFCLV